MTSPEWLLPCYYFKPGCSFRNGDLFETFRFPVGWDASGRYLAGKSAQNPVKTGKNTPKNIFNYF